MPFDNPLSDQPFNPPSGQWHCIFFRGKEHPQGELLCETFHDDPFGALIETAKAFQAQHTDQDEFAMMVCAVDQLFRALPAEAPFGLALLPAHPFLLVAIQRPRTFH